MAEIEACKIWNKTDITLERGKIYRFSSKGQWKDGGIICDSSCWDDPKFRFLERFRRAPDARWFSLVGAIDGKREYFDIGALIKRQEVWIAPTSGQLWAFANDLIFMYWNNSGVVELDIS